VEQDGGIPSLKIARHVPPMPGDRFNFILSFTNPSQFTRPSWHPAAKWVISTPSIGENICN
jgi:hypothetical protein